MPVRPSVGRGHGAQRGDEAGGCGRAPGGVRNATQHLAEPWPSALEGQSDGDLSGEPVSLAAPRLKPWLDSCGGRSPFLPQCSQSPPWRL